MAGNFLHSNAGGLNTETIRGSLFFGPPLRSPDLEGHILGFQCEQAPPGGIEIVKRLQGLLLPNEFEPVSKQILG